MIALLRVNLYPWVPFFSGLGKAKCWWVERQNGRICLVWSILQHQPSTWRGTLGSMGWSPSPLLSIRNSTGCSSFPIVNCQTEENCPKEMGRERCEGPSGFGSVGAALTGLFPTIVILLLVVFVVCVKFHILRREVRGRWKSKTFNIIHEMKTRDREGGVYREFVTGEEKKSRVKTARL